MSLTEIKRPYNEVCKAGITMPETHFKRMQANGEWSSQAHVSAKAAPKPKTIRVLLVDDHVVVRRGLASFLSLQGHIKIVGEAADGCEAIQKAKELSPDIVVMDLEMPQINGITALETLRREAPNVNVLVLSMHHEAEHVLRILKSAARGYVLKSASADELLRAIESVYARQLFLSSDVARIARNPVAHGPGKAPLSPREEEVLSAIADGLSNKEIASRLNAGVRTIETHRERIMRKLNIRSVAGLTKFAVMKGLVPLPSESTTPA